MKIGEIDTMRDRFAADVIIFAKWKEPELDGMKTLVRLISQDQILISRLPKKQQQKKVICTICNEQE